MTRAQEISELRRRYAKAIRENKRKTAAIIYARLCSLMARQLKAENREDRRAS